MDSNNINLNDIKQKIVEANKAYREGQSFLTDQEYDDLLESLKTEMSEEEYEVFVSTLNEGAIEKNVDGKVKHPFVMGSMEKIKEESPDEVKKWIGENIKTKMSISAKVDGISCRATYKNGVLVGIYSRGDGYFGMDFTPKAKYIKCLPSKLNYNFSGDVRGELVCFKSDFESIKDKYANPRNFVAGCLNRKEFNEEEVSLVTFVPYTIFGDSYTKIEQFMLLSKMGFRVVDNINISESDIGDDVNDVLFNQTTKWMNELDYEIDGLIICDETWKNEDKYRPDGCKAYKVNLGVGVTKVIGFDWGTPSANGRMTPVALLEPISLCGTIVKRVTCCNVSYLERMGIEIGKNVKVCKRGDIIPAIIEVLD